MKKPAPPAKQQRRLSGLDIGVIVATVLLVSFGVWNTLRRPHDTDCQNPGKSYQLQLKDDAFSRSSLNLNRCDTVKIVNLDTQQYELAFGQHDKHIAYPGYSIQDLQPNEFFVFDAIQAGTYIMHDHLRDNARIEFDIRAK